MTPRERVWAALRGEPVDRPPVSFWGHFYHRESTALDLVEATLEFQSEFHWDWVKLNPRKHYHVEPWGVQYHYSGRAAEKPVLERWPVQPEPHGRQTVRVESELGRLQVADTLSQQPGGGQEHQRDRKSVV